MPPEAEARQQIDALLVAAGWAVQDYKHLNPSAARGIALRKVPLSSGRCDYLLLVDRLPLGVIEAKKFAGARRVLFLVDRANLGKQAKGGSGTRQRHRPPRRRRARRASVCARQFDQFVAPDTGRKFTEIYNVQHLTSNSLDTVARVTICTIQRLHSILRGEAEFDEDLDEKSAAELSAAYESRSGVPPLGSTSSEKRRDGASTFRPLDVAYSRDVPLEAFDFIVTDECHRSIYGLWRQVLVSSEATAMRRRRTRRASAAREYFDAHLIGLTATPGKQTVGFFQQAPSRLARSSWFGCASSAIKSRPRAASKQMTSNSLRSPSAAAWVARTTCLAISFLIS